MKKIVALAALLLTAGAWYLDTAGIVSPNKAVVITWQTPSGRWKASGTAVCNVASETYETDAIRRAVKSKDEGKQSYKGSIGPYSIYSLNRDLAEDEYDKDARTCPN